MDFEEISGRLVADLIRDYGLSPAQATGVAASLAYETGNFQFMQELVPLIPGSQGGYGFAQWTGGRRDNFEDWVSGRGLDPTSYAANYGFLKHEIESERYYANAFNKVRQALTPAEATELFTSSYLRPGLPNMDKRIETAQRITDEVLPGIKLPPRPVPLPVMPPPDLQESRRNTPAMGPRIESDIVERTFDQLMQKAAPAMPTPADQRPPVRQFRSSERPEAMSWLTYSNQGATRSQPINDKLISAMSFLPELGVTMDVYSGGQPSAGNGARVGSARHDHGNAADVSFYKDGRMLDWNRPGDLPILSDIVSRARAGGVTGIGAGDDYMGAGRVHIGFGTPAVWGAGGKSANAPDWLKSAYYGAPAQNRALAAINAAAPQSAVMQPAKGSPMWSSPLAFAQQVGAPIMRMAATPQAQAAAIGGMMGSVQGRTAIMRALMSKNIGPAPTTVAGFMPGGTHAMAVTGAGATPVTVMKAGSAPSDRFDQQTHPGMDMNIYRHNAQVLGAGNMSQTAINKALSEGKTLLKKA